MTGPAAIHRLSNGSADARLTLVLAHGAGAPMDTPFMTAMSEGLARRDLRVIRFEFPYMAARRQGGGRKPPDRQPLLLDCWRTLIGQFDPARLAIGGKSMGGRMASLLADETGVRALVCLGYPFHPPGKPERLRTAHLAEITTPTLIVQGTRDPLGNRTEVAGYRLSPAIRLHWLEDGDHSFKPRRASGRSEAQNLGEAVAAVAEFLHALETGR